MRVSIFAALAAHALSVVTSQSTTTYAPFPTSVSSPTADVNCNLPGANNSAYTAQNGVNFGVRCGLDFYYDTAASAPVESYAECAEACSIYEGCRVFAFLSDEWTKPNCLLRTAQNAYPDVKSNVWSGVKLWFLQTITSTTTVPPTLVPTVLTSTSTVVPTFFRNTHKITSTTLDAPVATSGPYLPESEFPKLDPRDYYMNANGSACSGNFTMRFGKRQQITEPDAHCERLKCYNCGEDPNRLGLRLPVDFFCRGGKDGDEPWGGYLFPGYTLKAGETIGLAYWSHPDWAVKIVVKANPGCTINMNKFGGGFCNARFNRAIDQCDRASTNWKHGGEVTDECSLWSVDPQMIPAPSGCNPNGDKVDQPHECFDWYHNTEKFLEKVEC